MPDRDLIAKLNAHPEIVASMLGLPREWLSPAEPAHAGEAINIRVSPPPPPGLTAAHVYLFTIVRRLGDVGTEELRQGVGREAARLRGELAYDGYLWLLSCADQGEFVGLSRVQDHARAAGFDPAAPALFEAQRADAVVALTQLVGQVAEAQRNGKGDQLIAELHQLAGHALAIARAVVGRG